MNDNQLQQLLQAINTLQDLGKVAYFNKGAYNSETTYEINDVVTYQGSSYVSLGNNNQGNLPTNATYWSVVALKGDKGETGKPFVIEKTYISIQEMVADYDNMNVNDYVMISGSIEDEQNATLWTKTETPTPTYKWVYLADFSGASGITGQTPNIQIGNVTEGNEPAVTRRQGSTNENPILDFVLKTGAKGDTGATGNGISQVSKTSTSGLTDTYTIEYTSGNSTTFDVTNGKGITSIAKTGTSGLVDTYTITYNDGTTSTFTITNGEDGEVTQAQLDETNNQVAKANMVYNALPKVSDEGDSLTLDGTANCPMKMELKGNTEQTTYTGKNLYKANESYSFTQGTNSWTFVDGTRGANGSDMGDKTTLKAQVSNGTTYTFKVGNLITTATAIQLVYGNETLITSFNTTNIKDGYTFTSNTDGVVLLRIFVPANDNVSISQIQLEEGSTATPYEPYVGGTPSPNPNYPQDVRVVTGNNTINVTGKNLFDGAFRQGGRYTTSLSDTNRLFTTQNLPIKSGVSYTISTTLNTSNFKYAINLATIEYPIQNTTEENAKQYYDSGWKTSSPFTFTPSQDGYLGIVVAKINSSDDLAPSDIASVNWQLEYGSTTPYEPYQSQTYPINLGTMELCKIDTYQDYIYKDNGKWYKHSEIGKVVLDGSEDWITWSDASTGNTRLFGTSTYDTVENISQTALSNYFVNSESTIWATDEQAMAFSNSGNYHLRLRINKSIANDIEELEAWLSTHNTIVYYVLATPTNEEITDTTLISQLNAIENAVSYDTQTNIVQEYYSEPFIINAECVRSLKDIFELIGNS